MDQITKYLLNREFTEKTFRKLDKKLSVGVSAKTKSGKDIYTSKKKVSITVQIINKKDYKILEAQKKSLNTIRISPKKDQELGQLAVCEKKGHRACVNGKVIEQSTLNNTHLRVEYEGEDLIQEYNRRKKYISEICGVFNVNPANVCFTDTGVCRNIAHEKFKHIKGVEHVSNKEAIYINGSCRGQLNYADKGKVIENCFDYDINSMYSFLLSESNFSFPLSEGVEVPINHKSEEEELEIYKLKINGHHKYWSNTPDNYYNTYHIELLDKLNIPYEIIGETKLIYNQPIKAKEIFSYLGLLCEMKKKGNKYAKGVANCTWGNLSMKKKFLTDLEELNLDNDQQRKKIVRIDVMKGRVILQDPQQPFKHATGRLKAFLLAYGRLYIVKNILLPLEKEGFEVYQANCDGFITNAKPEEMDKIYDISQDIGDLKLEKEFKGKHTIRHTTRVDKFEEEDELDEDAFDNEMFE